MSTPEIADRKPVGVELKAGEGYHWCACGRSANQPFCDGSHRGTEFTHLRFEVEDGGKKFLCQCKRTGTPPFCDGSHKDLPEEGGATGAHNRQV